MTEATETEVVDQIEQTPDVESEESKRERLEREHYDEIRELNVKFVGAHQQWEILKDQTSGAKKRCDELGKRLSNLIARGPDLQGKLDFDQAANEQDPDDQADDQDKATAENNAWRGVHIMSALDLTDNQFEKLESEGVHNMGQLEDFRGSKGLRSIKGFGEKAVDKIEDQIIDWLTENRDKFGEPIDEEEPDDDQESEDEDPNELDEQDDETEDEGEDDGTDAEELLDEL